MCEMYLTDEQMNRYKGRKVILVDEEDNVLGESDIISAHRDGGRKHRAFSLILFRKTDGRVEVLLQRRALVKPIFPGVWANACCYNLAPGEEISERARSRVGEELGVNLGATELVELYMFSYEAEGESGWFENEVDHVLVGHWDGEVTANPVEAMDYMWIEWGEIKQWIERERGIFAPWFLEVVRDGRVEKYLSE